uniref:ciliated left-right organizer metallopeptidase n=1 Tax=Myxine glutinosa TaxID=7769 RepID=UPI00358FF92B
MAMAPRGRAADAGFLETFIASPRGRRLNLAIPIPSTDVPRAACVHESVQPASVPRTIVSYGSTPGRRRPRSARRKDLRVAVHLQAEPHGLLLPEEMARLEDDLVHVTRHLSRILSVVQVSGPLLLGRSLSRCCLAFWPPLVLNGGRCARVDKRYTGETCLGVKIPETHLRGFSLWPEIGEPTPVRHDGSGVPEADFVLYVQVAERPRCHTGIIAYGGFCQVDQNNRPIAGAINFCPNMLRSAVYDRQQMLMMTTHELIHVLGFSKDLFSKWSDCSMSDVLGVGCPLWAQVTNRDAHGQQRMYSPTVRRQMQQHLGCSSDDCGVPLENMGAAGLPSSHWEARTLYSSIMTAAPGPPTLSLLDPLTLAALQDTGWYRVSYHAARVLLWGKGQGHDFGLTSTCDDPSSRFFCLGSGSGCHHWHKDKGFCETDVFLEGCRVYKPFANGQGKETAASPLEGRCYRHRCQTQGRFDVMVESSPWITCPEGNTIEVPGYEGILECPVGCLCLDTQPLIFGSTMSPTQTPLMGIDLLSHNDSGSAEIIWTGNGKRLPLEKAGDVVALVAGACVVWTATLVGRRSVQRHHWETCRVLQAETTRDLSLRRDEDWCERDSVNGRNEA